MAENSAIFHIDVNRNVTRPASDSNELSLIASNLEKSSEISSPDFQQVEKTSFPDGTRNDCCVDISNLSFQDNNSLLTTPPFSDSTTRDILDETFSFSTNVSKSSEMPSLVESLIKPVENDLNSNPAENASLSPEMKCKSPQEVSTDSLYEQNQQTPDNLIKFEGENSEAKCKQSEDIKSPNLMDHLSSTRKDFSQSFLGDTFSQSELNAMLSQVSSTCNQTDSVSSSIANVSKETSNSEVEKSNSDFSCSEFMLTGYPPFPSTSTNNVFPDSFLVESAESSCISALEYTTSVNSSHVDIPVNTFEEHQFKAPLPANDNDDEEFTDAVQFFKDPSSLQFLENIQTSVPSESIVPRSSLYVTFDPLLSKFGNQQSKPASSLLNIEQTAASFASDETVNSAFKKNEVLEVTMRESLGNNLLSFDSPQMSNKIENNQSEAILMQSTVPKFYTHEELQKELKTHELQLQETYLKQCRLTEEEMKEIGREKDIKLKKLAELCKIQQLAIEELASVASTVTAQNKDMHGKLEKVDEENARLKEDIKVAGEDLQSVESTFSDFHKRYEQCKGMLKTYKENETLLKDEIDNWKVKFNEQLDMYNALQERTQEILEKANTEVAGAKKSNDAQVAVLKAQLKKAELKISSLESDIKQMRIENSKLGSICDDLMAKVRET